MDEIEKEVQFLAENYYRSIHDPNILEAKNKVEQFRNDPRLFDIVNQQYRPTEIEVGTVGSYLWGCVQNYYGYVNKSCSPLCSESLFKSDSHQCQYSIWTYDNKLKLQSNVSNSQAYIYVSKDWDFFFKKEDIEKLEKHGVRYATILKTENSQHKIIIPMTSIEELPRNDFELKEEKKSSSVWLYFLILILIFLVVYLYQNYNDILKK